MFKKLITIQNQKIDSLQAKLFSLNKDIQTAKQTIYDLRNNINFDIKNQQIGQFLAVSIHHQAIKSSIKLQEIIILEKSQEIIATKKLLKKENIILEKYTHIIQEDIKAKDEIVKYQEARELEDLLQRSNA